MRLSFPHPLVLGICCAPGSRCTTEAFTICCFMWHPALYVYAQSLPVVVSRCQFVSAARGRIILLVKIAPCTMIETFPSIKLLERLSMAIAYDAAAELGRNPVSKHQIQPEYGDEQTDAGRYCRTHRARPNSQARTRTGSIHFSCSADNVQDWQPYLTDPYSCYMDDNIVDIASCSKGTFSSCLVLSCPGLSNIQAQAIKMKIDFLTSWLKSAR